MGCGGSTAAASESWTVPTASSAASAKPASSAANVKPIHKKPGPRLTYSDSEAHARAKGGRLLTLEEARAHMAGRALYPGEDQWCAVEGRDWVQVGDRTHPPGRSHVQDCHHYPPWGDDSANRTYGNPTWNYVLLYTTNDSEALAETGAAQNNPALATELASAAWNGNLGQVQSLLERGAPADTEKYGGFSNGHHSALNGASRNGHDEIVQLLLDQPTRPDIESRCQGPWEVTPLQQAGYHGRAGVAKILLGYGASATSNSGPGCGHKTAKQIAEEMKNGQWKELVAAIDLHNKGGADPFERVDNHTFDKNGVLYAIGANFNKSKYSNPADSGLVSLQWSGDAANYYSTQGGHKVGDAKQASRVICANQHPGHNATQWSQGQPGAWFSLDLKNVSVTPTHFAYRNDYGGGGNHPRTFELQGSNDGKRWTTLSKHSGEQWSGNCAKHWPIKGVKEPYSKFKIINLGSPNHLCCSGIEIYGAIRQNGKTAAPVGGGSTTDSLHLGSTPSHGNPASNSELNTELNNVARNSDDTAKARALVAAGADLASTNGESWRHTPLHQASYHGRYEMAKTLVELGAPLHLHSNPCGRGANGTPLELARGGAHHRIAEMLEKAAGGNGKGKAPAGGGGVTAEGRWEVYHNIDMCFQGDAEIIGDWKSHTSIDKLKKTVEQKGYSAVCVGSFGHAALKSFDFQLTKEHCKPSLGYTNELHIWFPSGGARKPIKAEAEAEEEASRAEDGIFLIHDADFTGRDERTSKEPCDSLAAAAKLIDAKASGRSRRPDTAYAWRGKKHLVTIPTVGANEMGNGAKWSSGATLLVCGRDTGHRARGKMLIALKDVDCCFGDGGIIGGVHSYEAALQRIKERDNVSMTASFLHTSSGRLIEKPKNKGSNWVGYPGYGWLFLWADERVDDDAKQAKQLEEPPPQVVVGEVVMATAVAETVPEGVALGDSSSSSGVKGGKTSAMPLIELVEILKLELKLSGTVHEVVAQAAVELGLEFGGEKGLREVAIECVVMLQGEQI